MNVANTVPNDQCRVRTKREATMDLLGITRKVLSTELIQMMNERESSLVPQGVFDPLEENEGIYFNEERESSP